MVNFRKYLPEILVTVLLTALYYHTCATSITGEDSGSFHLALIEFGVNHPPGYPLYTILGALFTRFFSFLWTPSELVNLFSAWWALASFVVMFVIMHRLRVGKIASITAVVSAAFSVGLWSQSAVAEVYTMNVFMCLTGLALFHWFVTGLEKCEDEIPDAVDRRGFVLSFFLGLGLSHHYPLFILTLAPVILAFLIKLPFKTVRAFFERDKIYVHLGFFALGLTPYLYLILQGMFLKPAYLFGNLESLQDVWAHIMRKSYSVVDFQESSLATKLRYQSLVAELTFNNLRYFVLFALLGVYSVFRSGEFFSKALIGAFLGSSFFLALILGFPDTGLFNAVFRVYPLPAFAVLSIFVGFGVDFLIRRKSAPVTAAAVLLSLLFASEQFSKNYVKSSRASDMSSHYGAVAFLESMPKNARLLLSGDEGMSLYYAHRVLNVRPDLELIAYENSYTSIKILNYEEYRRAKKDPTVANFLRAQKIIAMLKEDRPFVSMNKAAFESVGVPFKSILFGFVADKGTSTAKIPESFDQTYAQLPYLEKVLSPHPIGDFWSDRNTMNFLPALIAWGAQFGLNPVSTYESLEKSEIGKRRRDFFEIEDFEMLRRISFKLFDMGKTEYALNGLKKLKGLLPYHKLRFEEKFIYCKILFDLSRISEDLAFCQRLLSENPDKFAAMNGGKAAGKDTGKDAGNLPPQRQPQNGPVFGPQLPPGNNGEGTRK